MRILLIKEHALTGSLATNQRLIPALVAMGHRVIPVDVGALATLFGHDGAQQLVVQHARAFQPHLALVFPPHDMLAPETCTALRDLGVPLVGWRETDAHHLQKMAQRPAAQRRFLALDGTKFTLNATTSRCAYEAMVELGLPSAAYLRLAGHLPVTGLAPLLPEVEIGFVGSPHIGDEDQDTAGRRGALTQILQKGLKLQVWGADWDQVPDLATAWQGRVTDELLTGLYHYTQINLNVEGWARSPVTPRMLDIAFSGGFQLIDACPELADYFEPGLESISVDSPTDLLSKIAYYRVYPEARFAVLAAAKARAERDHTWAARWPELLAALDTRWGKALAEDGSPDFVDVAAADGVLTAYRAMLHVSEAAERMEEAFGYAEAILGVAPHDYGALAARARWAEMVGDAEVAQRHWQMAGARFSAFTYPWAKPADLLGCLGTGRIVPGDPHAEAIWHQFNLTLALQDMDAMRALLPEMAIVDFDALESFAGGLFRNEEFELAAQIYGQLLYEAPAKLDVQLGLARSLLCLQRPDEARPLLEAILGIEPGHAEAKLLRSSTLT
ncbi:MAG: glycosyltransferase [Candidatus Sericytochromatia bacterium]|nr:glycosyltransferase [Candidatus Sericytochromatia bacterium]